MILKRFAFFLLLSLACLTQGIGQQTYPIQVNVHLLPPYSLYLSDYYSGTREKLTVTLINRDQLKPTVNVKLRMIITAPGGIRIQTNDNAYFQPVIVESGSPVRLTQDDLAQYFQPANLITQGYLTAGKLPEGMVEFCFQAIEAYTGQVLSASTCTRAWITSQKPPLLSLPRNKESIAFRDPLNVLFQWTPLHQGLGLVEYDFILKELWDNGMTPQAAFAYSPEIYRETTQSTSIIYGAMQPPLLAGKRYAWCVRAKAREGLDEVNLFQNDGYSEIRWFTLQDNCAPPQYVQAATERKRINLEWNTLPEYIGFTVSYRLKSNADQPQAEWKELQLQDTKATLYGLQSGGTYEYRVASMCMTGQPVYTPVFTITVPMADSARLAQCGILPAVNLTNQEPIKELKTAEVFKAGDFPITIVSISGANGNFSGQGWTIIPWLNDAKIAVEFKSITINTDRQMTNGIVEAKYDKNEGQIANLDDVFEGGFDVGNVKTGLTQPDYKFDFSIPGVDAFALNDNGELVITDDTGEPHTVTAADKEGEGNEGNKVVVFPMTVQDKDGNVYSVEKETKTDANGKTKVVAKATYLGKVGTPLAAGSFDPTQLNGDKAIVTFTKGSGKYAFDTWKEYYDKIALIQDKYQKLYTNYYAPWKFLPSGQTDKVSATIEIKDETIKPELVIFKTPTGTEYEAVRNDKTYTLQVASGPEGDVQELYALYPRENGKYYTLGKLGIATYAPQNYNVVLVAVDNAYVNYEKIEQTLKETYDSVGVTWTVSRDAFAYNASELMKNSTGLSTYNDAMRDLNNAYRAAHPDFNSNSNYLFFLKATGNTDEINNRDLTGFMPRGAQFGYIFTSEVKDADEPITVAHELGHGRWKLYHPFDKHYGGFDEARQTNNLLAYGNGSHIAKWQWDQMNDPAMLVSVFESDDRSASDHVKIDKLLAWIRDSKGKKVDFKKYDFYETSSWVDVVQLANYEGEQLPLYVELGDNGKIDLTTDAYVYNRIGISIDLKKTKHTGFYLEVYYAENSGSAIKIWAYAYKDFERLLKKLGLAIKEESYPYYIDLYKKAITDAGDDCNKLDVLFETIPPFVTPALGDENLYKALKSISKCSMDDGGFFVQGTDEEISVVNILKGYANKSDLYKKLYDNAELVKDLYVGLDGDDEISFVNILRELSDKFGELSTKEFLYLGNVPPEIYEENPSYKGMVFTLTDGSGFTGNSLSISYVIGRVNWSPLNLGTVEAHKNYPVISKINPLDPVRLHFENQEEAHVVPALYAYYHGIHNNRDYLLGAVGTATNILGLSSSVRILLTRGAPRILRALAVIEISKAAVDQVMQKESVKKSITDAGGAWFVDNWQWISISVDLTVFSADVISNLVTSGTKASKALKEIGENDAAEAVDKIIEKADDVAADLVKEADKIANALRQFDVAGEFAKGKNVVEFSIEWGGQSYKLTWSKLNGKIDFGDRSQLARILGTSGDIEAHHLVSWIKGGQHRVVQSAANDGFHLNMVENGLGLKKYTKLTGEGLHGNHPAYDDFLTYKLDDFARGKSETFTIREANDFLQTQLIPEIKTHISNAGNTQLNLNEYFKQIVNKNIGVPGY